MVPSFVAMGSQRDAWPLLVFLGLMGLVPGCARPRPQVEPSELNLRRIVQAYDLYCDRPGRVPRQESDLVRWFKELGDERDPQVILTSPRDGKPYVILFGVPLDPGERTTILAYEREG